jgi:hypothetical protein
VSPARYPAPASMNVLVCCECRCDLGCARTNPGASDGRMPANVFVRARATVTAGLANEVEAVNQ